MTGSSKAATNNDNDNSNRRRPRLEVVASIGQAGQVRCVASIGQVDDVWLLSAK